jgi:FdhD protein
MRKRGKKMVTLEREILRVKLNKGIKEIVKDEIVVEDFLELYINNTLYTVFACSPHQLKELVVGHLITEGIINKMEEIISLEISKRKSYVCLNKKPLKNFSQKPQIIFSSCSSRSLKIPPHLWMKPREKNKPDLRIKAQALLQAVAELNSKAFVFKRTGGTHASAIFHYNGKMAAFSEDIGRHNTLDKVIGKATLKGLNLKRTMLASTGRLTSEMTIKAATARIPIIVSMSAPTDKGIKIAKITGLTLIGFARGTRFNIYANPERIILTQNNQNP